MIYTIFFIPTILILLFLLGAAVIAWKIVQAIWVIALYATMMVGFFSMVWFFLLTLEERYYKIDVRHTVIPLFLSLAFIPNCALTYEFFRMGRSISESDSYRNAFIISLVELIAYAIIMVRIFRRADNGERCNPLFLPLTILLTIVPFVCNFSIACSSRYQRALKIVIGDTQTTQSIDKMWDVDLSISFPCSITNGTSVGIFDESCFVDDEELVGICDYDSNLVGYVPRESLSLFTDSFDKKPIDYWFAFKRDNAVQMICMKFYWPNSGKEEIHTDYLGCICIDGYSLDYEKYFYYLDDDSEWVPLADDKKSSKTPEKSQIFASNIDIYDGSGNLVFTKTHETSSIFSDETIAEIKKTATEGPEMHTYWVAFLEGSRDNRLELSVVDSPLSGDALSIIWDNGLSLSDNFGKYECRQYYYNELDEWQPIGTRHRLSDNASEVIASNLPVFDSDGSILVTASNFCDIDFSKYKNSDINDTST